jgi:vacuolar-type H+-ATPase subunit H
LHAAPKIGGRRQLVSNAKKNADQIVSGAKAQADQLLTEVKADAERHRAATQREVDELTRQKDSIASHLAQVRQLLGAQVPSMDAVQAAHPSLPSPVTQGSLMARAAMDPGRLRLPCRESNGWRHHRRRSPGPGGRHPVIVVKGVANPACPATGPGPILLQSQV